MKSISAGSWANKLVESFQEDGCGRAVDSVLSLTADEADLLEPLQPAAYESWVVPLTVRPNDAANEAADETADDWPDAGRAEIAQWVAPEASKPNGRGPRPPRNQSALGALIEAPTRKASETNGFSPRRSPTPYAGKARHGRPPISAKVAEQRLLTALQEHSGASVAALAKAAGANPSSIGERLRGLGARGVVAKDSAGRWRLVAELAGETAGPTQPPAR